MTTTTIDINDAAEVVMNAEAAALKALKAKLDQLADDLAEIEKTLPSSLTIDASRVINEVRGNLTYTRNTSLPQALNRYEPAVVPVMPAMYAPGTGPLPTMPGSTDNG
ncbi:hypothetical protein [Sphingomonas aerolata]|uniref:hypothetical protein n=1 Tax=Sphingomonas aerolata TaxID=185951 RepID=UPI00334AACAB